MTKSEGHNFMTNLFCHWLSDLTRSDPMWLILRGKIMTKLEGHISESAKSSSILYMGRAQQFSLFVFFSLNFGQQHGEPLYPASRGRNMAPRTSSQWNGPAQVAPRTAGRAGTIFSVLLSVFLFLFCFYTNTKMYLYLWNQEQTNDVIKIKIFICK